MSAYRRIIQELRRYCRREDGVSLVEMIIAIVVIGITLPAIMIPFTTALKGSKRPEFVTQASFLAQKYTEKIASRTGPTVTCADIPATDGEYSLSCAMIDVDAATPDDAPAAGQNNFAKKVTITIARADGNLPPTDFYTLFAK